MTDSNFKKGLFFLTVVVFCLLGYLLRIKLLMLVSMVEFMFIGQKFIPLQPAPACKPEIVFHRGYAQSDKYPENSFLSLEQAVKDSRSKVEIDVIIKDNAIFVSHERDRLDFKLSEFAKHFARQFELLVIDIKFVTSFNEATLDELLSLQQHFARVIYIGRKCDLLADLAKHKGTVSCEAIGLLGHKIMGWEYWSVNYETLGPNYQRLIKIMPHKLLLWTWPSATDSQRLCTLAPSILLVDHP